MYVCKSGSRDEEAGGLFQVQGKPKQHGKTLSQKENQEEIKQIIPKRQTNKPKTSKKIITAN